MNIHPQRHEANWLTALKPSSPKCWTVGEENKCAATHPVDREALALRLTLHLSTQMFQ